MFSSSQLEKYAQVLLWGLHTARSGGFGPADIILLRYDRPAVALAEILFAKIMEADMHPVQRMSPTINMEKRFFEQANDAQLAFRTPGDAELYRQLNGSIFLHAPESLTHLGHIPSEKLGKAAVTRKYLRDILDQREEKGLFGWTLCGWPTPEQARHAGLSLEEYTAQIANACFLDDPDPVACWKTVYDNALALKAWLNALPVDHYHVESDHVDLKVFPGAQRKWIGLSGHNIPSFELFLSPDCRKTEGVYYADQPSYRDGKYVEGVRLTFRNGWAVSVSAETGEAFVKKQLAMDTGANRLGEFSLTDRRFSRISAFMANTLYDENYGGEYGNCHIAVGASYSDTYDGDLSELTPERKKALGFNDSALHWDLVNTEPKRVTAHLSSGGKTVIYENGEFLHE